MKDFHHTVSLCQPVKLVDGLAQKTKMTQEPKS